MVEIKHGKNVYKISLEHFECLNDFKKEIERISKVPVERQTLISKGRKMKSDDDLKKIDRIILIGSSKRFFIPKQKIVLNESPIKKDKITSHSPVGLVNLGNSCYMNSVVQVLRNIPEINSKLIKYYNSKNRSDNCNLLLVKLGELLNNLETSLNHVKPIEFWTYLLQTFPQLLSKDEKGNFKQQDAGEVFGLLLNLIKTEFGNDIEKLFKGKMFSKLKCIEDLTEKIISEEEDFFELKCHITVKINDMVDGITSSLYETIEKRGDNSKENKLWKKEKFIFECPKYIVVHFVRFYWKIECNNKAKIMRKVSFPVDKPFELEYIKNEKKQIQNYYLDSVITHQGPYADSGHYVAWCKQKDKWNLFDDNNISTKSSDDIQKLYGGGEWHSAYLALYRKEE